MTLARVFPRRTNATPTDSLAFIGEPDLFAATAGIERVHISVSFTWDIPAAERLEKAWRQIAPTEIGGPAMGQPGGDFEPGKYLKEGYVITSRGCPNRCWFCGVWKREGDTVRELPVTQGWNVLDDNLLACSDAHIREVFYMLQKQKEQVLFTGGLEAAKLKQWHVEELAEINPKRLFFAYDTPEDKDPLFEAGRLLKEYDFRICDTMRAYVLVGYHGDTFEKAETRLRECIMAGFMPMAMLYRDWEGRKDHNWGRFQREWARPAIINKKVKEYYHGK